MSPWKRPTLISAIALVSLAASGCGDRKRERAATTERERDSVIGESALPGASGVQGALAVADSARARRELEAQQN